MEATTSTNTLRCTSVYKDVQLNIYTLLKVYIHTYTYNFSKLTSIYTHSPIYVGPPLIIIG